MNRFRNLILSISCGFCLIAFQANTNAAVVQEWGFDTDNDTEGWITDSNNISGLTTTGGFLTGTASGNDPQLRMLPATGTNFTRDASATWDSVVFRVREVADAFTGAGGTESARSISTFNSTGIVVQVNGVVLNSGASFSAVDSGSNFFTVTADISGLSAASITTLRIDPIGGALSNSNSQTDGNTFEVDFIRLTDTATAVPEPASFVVFALFGAATVARRKRRMRPASRHAIRG